MSKTNLIKLKTKESAYFYTTTKSKNVTTEKKTKLSFKKYNPFTRTYTIFNETKIK